MKRIVLFISIVATLFISMSFTQNNGDAILGQWLSADKNGKFLIYKTDNKYFGKIIWGQGGDSKDSKNPDPKLRSRELIGLVILRDFVFDGYDTWENGTIYNPQDGKTYSCKLSLKSETALNVRGYIGVSLFGKTEIWTKVK